MTLIANTLCTEAEMKRLFSTAGVQSFGDHEQTGAPVDDVTDDCINQATEEIRGYVWMWYSDAQLATSTLVNRWATFLSCWFLCQRRGNGPPESWVAEFERIMAVLQRIMDGTYRIPGLALRGDLRPSMSNLEIDRRYRHSTVRVTQPNSSNVGTSLIEHQADEVMPLD